MKASLVVAAVGVEIVFALHPAYAADAPDARAIIGNAIEFAGGREALAAYEKPFRIERKGKALGAGGWDDFSMTVTVWFPNKGRWEQTMRGRVWQTAFNGEKGLVQRLGGGFRGNQRIVVEEMTPQQAKARKELIYMDWLTTLLPLDDEAFTLTTADDIMLENRPAVGVKISHEEHPDVELYFDKQTFALVKQRRRVNEHFLDFLYDEYVEVDGLVYPKTIVQMSDGKKSVEMETTELKFLDSVEEAVFEELSTVLPTR